MSFIEELKRRKVFRVAASYAVVAFIIMQLVEIVFPIFDFPQWTSQFVIILVLIGFPISVILSWVFDRTPHGYIKTESQNDLNKETDVKSKESKSFFKNKKNWLLVAGVIAGILIGRFGQTSGSSENIINEKETKKEKKESKVKEEKKKVKQEKKEVTKKITEAVGESNEEAQEEESTSETSTASVVSTEKKAKQKKIQSKKALVKNIDRVMDKIDRDIKDLSKNLNIKNLIKLEAMVSEQASLVAYNKVEFYKPKDIYLDQLNIFDPRKIYSNVTLTSYTKNDTLEIKTKKLNEIHYKKQKLLMELKELKNG